jgi:hypothetical protein
LVGNYPDIAALEIDPRAPAKNRSKIGDGRHVASDDRLQVLPAPAAVVALHVGINADTQGRA